MTLISTMAPLRALLRGSARRGGLVTASLAAVTSWSFSCGTPQESEAGPVDTCGNACATLDSECTVGVCDATTGACVATPAHEGELCADDGDACNRVSRCSGGDCVEVVAPVNCSSLDGECTVGMCEPATGACVAAPAHDGELCADDGDMCTGVSQCSGGVCTETVAPVSCAALDSDCTVGVCDRTTGACAAAPAREGAVCADDGDACDGVSRCSGGACQEAEGPVSCASLDGECAVGVCDPATGRCSASPLREGELCSDDGDACNGVSRCSGGTCTEVIAPVSCAALDGECAVGVCDPTAGVCSASPLREGELCSDDGDACNGVSRCSVGTCTEVIAPVNCASLDGECVVGVCDATTGTCSASPVREGELCADDGDACNGVSRCSGGACTEVAVPVSCASLDGECTVGTCDPATGACSASSAREGELCADDGDPCTGVSRCGGGSCAEVVAPVSCTSLDGECTVGVCDATTGTCVTAPAHEGDVCADDGDACNGVSRCSGGACSEAQGPVSCSSLDGECAVGVCDATTGACSASPVREGELCADDGDACTGVSRCVGGRCTESVAPVSCSSLDTECSVGECDPTTGACSASPAREGELCEDDGDACNGVSRCSVGACTQVVAPVSCAPLDGECTVGVCDATTGACSASPAHEGELCADDGDACNGVSRCSGGACTEVLGPASCSWLDGECTVGVCDPTTGSCSASPAHEGELCADDGDACNGVSRCSVGACTQVVAPVSCATLDGECTVGACDPATGTCSAASANEGELCADDGDACNGVSRCSGGACLESQGAVSCDHLNGECAVGACDPATGACHAAPANNGYECRADGNRCNGVYLCGQGTCSLFQAPVACDDGNPCTQDFCEPLSGQCVSDGQAMEGRACNVEDLCRAGMTCVSGVCQGGVATTCDDGDPCTLDACYPATGACVHAPGTTVVISDFSSSAIRRAVAVPRTADIIVAGVATDSGGSQRMWIARYSIQGELRWQTLVGNPGAYARDVELLDDGGVVAVGADATESNGYDVLLVRLDADGNVLWSKRNGGSSTDVGADVLVASDGGFVVGGYTWAGDYDAYILKVSSNGVTQWAKVYGDSATDTLFELVATPTGFAAAAQFNRWPALVMFDADGALVRFTTFSCYSGASTGIVATSDGGFTMTGVASYLGYYDHYLTWHVDADATTIAWSATAGGQLDDIGRALAQYPDGTILTAGAYEVAGPGTEQIYLVQYAWDGTLEWSQRVGTDSHATTAGFSVSVLDDGAALVAGAQAGQAIWFVVDRFGQSCALPPQFGELCTGPTCDSGICVEDGGGTSICTLSCEQDSDCPAGSCCALATASGLACTADADGELCSPAEGERLQVTLSSCFGPSIVDVDADGLDDGCEHELAYAFRPALVFGDLTGSTRFEHWAATPTPTGRVSVFYALSYFVDLGVPLVGGLVPYTGALGHDGDSEFIVLELEHVANGNWRLYRAYLSSHFDAPVTDSSRWYMASELPFFDVQGGRPLVFVADSKHGNYTSVTECEAGGCYFDRCDVQSTADVRVFADRNLGQWSAHLIDAVTLGPNTEWYWTDVRFCGWQSGSAVDGRDTCAPEANRYGRQLLLWEAGLLDDRYQLCP